MSQYSVLVKEHASELTCKSDSSNQYLYFHGKYLEKPKNIHTLFYSCLTYSSLTILDLHNRHFRSGYNASVGQPS